METKAYLGWVDFYMELADKLLPYKNDRKTLIEKNKHRCKKSICLLVAQG